MPATTAARQQGSNSAAPKPATWQLQEAKNRFSEVVRRAQDEPQIVTVRGEPAALIVSYGDYHDAFCPKKLTFLELMATCPAGVEELEPYLARDKDATVRPVMF